MDCCDLLQKVIDSLWVQVVPSVALVIVTLYYAIITNRILHAPYRAYLKPVDLVWENPYWVIVVKNFGPGTATQVKAKAALEKKGGTNKTKKFTACEFSDIPPNEKARQSFEKQPMYVFKPDYPVILKWKSILGKKEKSKWFYIGANVFVQANVTSMARSYFNRHSV